MDGIVVVSGGFDSVTLLHHLYKNFGYKLAVITFEYGQKHQKEVEFAIHHVNLLNIDKHKIIDISMFSDLWSKSSLVDTALDIPSAEDVMPNTQPSTYVPNRNMLFLSLAVAWAETIGTNKVFYGAQKHDIYGYWDTTPTFLENLNKVYALQTASPIQIVAPFIEASKAEILEVGIRLNVDYSKTWSCYRGTEFACGKCPTCVERLSAFRQRGMTDPIMYK